MQLSLGIVGLPNVGKSTLFNALTQNGVPAENYPFCTIDPNVGIVPVMDPRLDKLAALVKPAKVTPAVVEFWDIAGIVKGAAEGQGLGNKFLANIRNVNAIVHVVRGFENSNVTHVENSVDPARDIELINTELILKDLETVAKSKSAFASKARVDPKQVPVAKMVEELEQHLSDSKLANAFEYDTKNIELVEAFQSLSLLTAKPVLYVLNVDESHATEALAKIKPHVGDNSDVIVMDIKLEAEIMGLPEAERKEYLVELGMDEPALARLTRAAYSLLGLISFFTAGETEVRAWTIKQGTLSPGAAGTIHTDFEKKFITSDVVKYEDFIAAGGWEESRKAGKVKLGGKDYLVIDGDVMLFKHNA
jgi:GTP-binding protein YchF